MFYIFTSFYLSTHMEFVVYVGRSRQKTINIQGLSKTYRFERSVPVPVASENDKLLLLGFKETFQSSCCGRKSSRRSIWSDRQYCSMIKRDLQGYRDEWTEFYQKHNFV